MLTPTDMPENTWQRDVFHAVQSQINAAAPLVAAWLEMVSPTPDFVSTLLVHSDNRLAMQPTRDRTAQISALVDTIMDAYTTTGGEQTVLSARPDLADEAPPVRRGPGRPRTTPDPRLEPAPRIDAAGAHSHASVLRGVGAPLQTVLDQEEVIGALRDEMLTFVDRLASQTTFFDDLRFGDHLVRTWSASELTTLLGVSAQTLTNWRRLGYGPGFVTVGARGDSVRYPVFRVVQWLVDDATIAEHDDEDRQQ